jgi:hypothetical protein
MEQIKSLNDDAVLRTGTGEGRRGVGMDVDSSILFSKQIDAAIKNLGNLGSRINVE